MLRHWFAAADSYSDIEEFRIAINACIQAARNVTFVLQSNKKHIDSFDHWYGGWQAAMAVDPIMKWCVAARNQIVKQGDLESFSVAKVLLFNSHAEPIKRVLAVDPMLTGQEIAEVVKNKYLPDELKQYGYLQVERQWITKDLKGVELLSALSHAFSVLHLLLQDIEEKKGPLQVGYKSEKLEEEDFNEALEFLDDFDKPPCMLAFEEYRKTNYNLATEETETLRTETIRLDENRIPDIEARYGHIKSSLEKMGSSLESRVLYHLKIAKDVIVVDDYLLTIVAIFDSKDRPHMISTMFRGNEDKYLFWLDVAKRVKKLKARMVVTTGDTWYAKLDSNNPLKFGERIADIDRKSEAVMACGMDRYGNVVTINAPYYRENDKIVFKDDEKIEMKPEFLNPVSKAFKKLRWK